ncbi:MOB kinase activator-like 3 isoform X2 [Hetaerina americana]|uniref:MOB kinase activator-like 3 isoform X2 n=1 Tax=Hetaerina americana TaxID=62018 RepID=UPI003A7F260E
MSQCRNRYTERPFVMALSGFVEFFQKGKTFRPKKKFEPGTLRYSLHKHAQASLSSGINLRTVVQLPPGEDLNDWIAVHVVDFFNRINLIYGTVCDYCTDSSCPTMSGGPRFEYLWADGVRYRKPTALPAPQYVSLLMDWAEGQINDDSLFPVSTDVPFPKSFVSHCRKILTRLFRVFVHVYIHHFDRIVAIGAEAHVNTCYKHFYYFVREFDLVSPKELEPLAEMTSRICRDTQPPPQPPPQKGGPSTSGASSSRPNTSSDQRPPLPLPTQRAATPLVPTSDHPLCEPSSVPAATSSRGLR